MARDKPGSGWMLKGMENRVIYDDKSQLLSMFLYKIFRIRYFISKKTLKEFYRGFSGIPAGGAPLSVIALYS